MNKLLKFCIQAYCIMLAPFDLCGEADEKSAFLSEIQLGDSYFMQGNFDVSRRHYANSFQLLVKDRTPEEIVRGECVLGEILGAIEMKTSESLRDSAELSCDVFIKSLDDFGKEISSSMLKTFPCGSVAETNYLSFFLLSLESAKQKRDLDLNIQNFERVIELNSCFIPAYFFRGFSCYQKNMMKEAILDFDKVLEYSPDNVCALVMRANALRKDRSYNLSLSDFSRVTEIRPDSSRGYFGRVDIFQLFQAYDFAIEDLTSIITLHGDKKLLKTQRAYYQRAHMYLLTKRYELALNDLELVLTQDDGDVDLLYVQLMLVDIMCAQKRYDDAQVIINSLLEKYRNDKQVLFMKEKVIFYKENK